MFFLPGTSVAAILSMPFFDDDLQGASKAWLWVVLTLPLTIAPFAFYFWRQSRNHAQKDDSIEMTPLIV